MSQPWSPWEIAAVAAAWAFTLFLGAVTGYAFWQWLT